MEASTELHQNFRSRDSEPKIGAETVNPRYVRSETWKELEKEVGIVLFRPSPLTILEMFERFTVLSLSQWFVSEQGVGRK